MSDELRDLLKRPLSVFVLMMTGISLFSLGATFIGNFIFTTYGTGVVAMKGMAVSVSITLTGLILICIGFFGIGEQIIDSELRGMM